jgi:serine/threonine protein kinase
MGSESVAGIVEEDRSSDLRLVYSPAVDVYGVGMVFYEILTGQIPFEGHRKPFRRPS